VSDLLLVPSPLLGPATWEPVADWLRAEGNTTRVVDISCVRSPGDLVETVVQAAAGEPVVLVPHSNAGLAVPVLGSRLELTATVFVDAALPLGTGSTAMAPEGLLTTLRSLADGGGQLPPWTQWWDDLTGLFPDDATRATVEAAQPRLPLSYFTARLPVPDLWSDRPAAYLAFGDTYADELAFATGCGWPTRTTVGRHLHQLHDPTGVATAILELLDQLRA